MYSIQCKGVCREQLGGKAKGREPERGTVPDAAIFLVGVFPPRAFHGVWVARLERAGTERNPWCKHLVTPGPSLQLCKVRDKATPPASFNFAIAPSLALNTC